MCSVWHKKQRIDVLLALCLTLFSSLAFCYEPSDEELSYLYGDDDFVSIATGHKQRIAEAPAVASVITAQDIRAMGATDLDQVLETVPGLHVGVEASLINPIYSIRGIYSERNPQTLVLVNGFPVTSAYLGSRGGVWGGMQIEMIARIEVIRGPGSALYGADALAGVVNIITKNGRDIEGLETGASAGSFDTKRGWLLYGGQINGWDLGFGLELKDTDGHRRTINADAQTLLDPTVSLAPGSINAGRQLMDMRLDFEKDEWRIRAGYQGRRKIGTGAGVNQALDPVGLAESDRINLDITYHKLQIAKDWDFKTAVSYFDTSFTTEDITLLPPGTFGGFPDGLIGNPSVYERHYRFDMSTLFSGVENHDVSIGAGYHYLDVYRVEESKNFDLSMGFPPVDLGAVRSVTGDALFNKESLREVTYLFLQDEWRIARDWELVAGLRYDHFSDFGGTLNPRLALIWNNENLTTKLLFGRAFRAPSFAEQFNRNNPVIIGNENLDPENIDTYEVAFDYAYSPDLRVGLNLFYYKMQDIIRFTPVAMNTGDQTGKGFELEFNWEIDSLTHLIGNYAFQHSRDKETGSPAANAPEQQVYFRLEHELLPAWSLSAQVNSVMGRNRAEGDTRKALDDYTTLDMSLNADDLLFGWNVSMSVFNVTDEDAREPSFYDVLSGTVAIPDDLPLPGRSFVVTLRKHW